MKTLVLIGLLSIVLAGCNAQTHMFVDPTNLNRYSRCWAEGGGAAGAGLAAGAFDECEAKLKSMGLRPVEEKSGGMTRKSMITPVTVMRAPDGSETRCEATADRAAFEVPGTGYKYMNRAVQAERDCIERLKRQGYTPVWVFEKN